MYKTEDGRPVCPECQSGNIKVRMDDTMHCYRCGYDTKKQGSDRPNASDGMPAPNSSVDDAGRMNEQEEVVR